MKPDLFIILFFLLALAMIALNELGFGPFALFLLFPAAWLAFEGFEDPKS